MTESYPGCRDCLAVYDADSKSLEHNDSCPVGAGIAATTVADKEWFERHPNATEYHRPVSWAESVEYGLRGFPGATHVLVKHLAPSVRARIPYARKAKA